jgi:hypothetical protein
MISLRCEGGITLAYDYKRTNHIAFVRKSFELDAFGWFLGCFRAEFGCMELENFEINPRLTYSTQISSTHRFTEAFIFI